MVEVEGTVSRELIGRWLHFAQFRCKSHNFHSVEIILKLIIIAFRWYQFYIVRKGSCQLQWQIIKIQEKQNWTQDRFLRHHSKGTILLVMKSYVGEELVHLIMKKLNFVQIFQNNDRIRCCAFPSSSILALLWYCAVARLNKCDKGLMNLNFGVTPCYTQGPTICSLNLKLCDHSYQEGLSHF